MKSRPLPLVVSATMREAMQKTVAAYRALIADPAAEISKWNRYGEVNACRLCAAAKRTKDSAVACKRCPCSYTPDSDRQPDDGSKACVGATYVDLHDAVDHQGRGAFDSVELNTVIRWAARARLRYLLKAFKRCGFEDNVASKSIKRKSRRLVRR